MKLVQYSFEFKDCLRVSYKSNRMEEGSSEVTSIERAWGASDCFQVLDRLIEDHEKSNKQWALDCVDYDNVMIMMMLSLKFERLSLRKVWRGIR